MKYWLLKSEPSVFGISHLKECKESIWDGVRNYQARNNLMKMSIGDKAFFYHSSCKEPGIVGLVEIIDCMLVDPTQFDQESDYYDVKATKLKPKWFTVRVRFERELGNIVQIQSHLRNYVNNTLQMRFPCFGVVDYQLCRLTHSLPRVYCINFNSYNSKMDEIFSKFTDKYNCEPSDRTDDYYLQQCQFEESSRSLQRNQREHIELKFRQSKQQYVFPRLELQSSDSRESIQSVVDLNCNKHTIESPRQKTFSRLKTEGNEKSEEQFDLNFNFNSSSEQLSDDAVVLTKQIKPYEKKLKPPCLAGKKRQSQNLPYKSILNDLERKLHTINCKDFYKKETRKPTSLKKGTKSRSIKTQCYDTEMDKGRMKSNSNSTTHQSYYNTQYYRPASQKSKKTMLFTEATPLQTKTSSMQKSMPMVSDSKNILNKKQETINCHDYLLSILQKHKSKSTDPKKENTNTINNPTQQSHLNIYQQQYQQHQPQPIFNVNNSNINLNVNINSNTVGMPRRNTKRPQDTLEHTLTVAQILKKNGNTINNNRSSLSSYQQRNSNRCSTEPPHDEVNPKQRFKKKKEIKSKQQTRCNTVLEQQKQTTYQYLNNLKQQQGAKLSLQSNKARNSVKQRSLESKQQTLEQKYKKPNLQIEMI